MTTSIQLARGYAHSYETSSRRDKGTILDSLTEATGWTRDHARHQLRSQIHQIETGVALGSVTDRRHLKPKKFSSQAQGILRQVWENSGRPCGKYLEAAMADCLASLERHEHLRTGHGGYSASVRRELLNISAATIDRYLSPAKTEDSDDCWLTGTGAELRASLPRRRMRSVVEPEPGYFIVELQEIEAGPNQSCPSITFTDVHIGWVQTRTFAPGTDLLDMLAASVRAIPYIVTGVILTPLPSSGRIEDWAQRNLIEFHWMSDLRQGSRLSEWTFKEAPDTRCDEPGGTEATVAGINELWDALGNRLNFFMPIKNPISWQTTPTGRRRRVYDTPATPVSRLIESGILCPTQTHELEARSRELDISALTRRVEELKTLLQ